jgi:spore germination protein YaaH
MRRHRRRRIIIVVAAGAAIVGGMIVGLLSACESPEPRTSPEPERSPMRIGYVPYWDQDRAFNVVHQNPEVFDQVSPVWYAPDALGRVELADADNTTVDLDTVRSLQARGIQVMPTVTNLRDGEWDPETVQAMLHNPAAVDYHIDELVDLAVANGYDGIDIDYEDLSGRDRKVFSEFLTKLGTALDSAGKQLTVAVHPKTSDEGDDERNVAQDYQVIGAAADQVRIMTYDYSWDTSRPGPVAPADWVQDVIAWTVTQVPREKVIIGIVLLGYDWGDGPGITVDHEQARSIARANDATIRRSEDGSPWFAYSDSSGTRHEVWYEDSQSARAKLTLVSEYGLGGAFFWRLGGEDPRIWPTAREELQ